MVMMLPAKLSLLSPLRQLPPVDESTPRRHLIYFIFPVANDIWKWNVDHVHKRLPLFNGRRIVSIMSNKANRSRGFDLDQANTVIDYFGRGEADFILVDPPAKIRTDGKIQEPKVGEPAAFARMLQLLLPFRRPNDYTFYAHAKGVTHPVGSAAWRWAKLLYKINLDHWDLVNKELQEHSMAGGFLCTKYIGHHYPGTFFWFRNKDVFDGDWGNVPMAYGGVEKWPGKMFPVSRLANLFGPGDGFALYRSDVMDEQEAEYERVFPNAVTLP